MGTTDQLAVAIRYRPGPGALPTLVNGSASFSSVDRRGTPAEAEASP